MARTTNPQRHIEPDAARRDASLQHLVAEVLADCQVDEAFSDLIAAYIDRWFGGGDGPSPITLLPVLTCAAAGGEPLRAMPLCAAWALVRLAAKLLDDVEDGDLAEGQARQINASTGVLALAHLAVHALESRGVPASRVHHIDIALSRAVLRAAGGQHRDLGAMTAPETVDPDTWLAIAQAKSGDLFAWAAWAGAAVAPSARLGGPRLEGYRGYGEHLGVLLQIADDYSDFWPADSGAPAEAPRSAPIPGPNLAIAYALSATDDHERAHLLQRLRDARVGADDASEEVRAMAIDLGAQAFLLAAGLARRRLAAEALTEAKPQQSAEEQLLAALDGIMPALGHLLGHEVKR